MILGLDISTSFTGFTVLTEDGHILHNEAIDLRKNDSIFKKANKVKERLTEIKNLYNIKDIFIEQSLNAFRPGLSSAQVILLLGKFNGVVSWICYEIFGKEPQYIGASTARKALGIKIEKGSDTKTVVLENILKLEPSFKVEYTKHGNPVAGVYDRADSLVIAKAAYIQCQKLKN
jgi:Holliday junction resolvasome RuvABC endonuclease subunit